MCFLNGLDGSEDTVVWYGVAYYRQGEVDLRGCSIVTTTTTTTTTGCSLRLGEWGDVESINLVIIRIVTIHINITIHTKKLLDRI